MSFLFGGGSQKTKTTTKQTQTPIYPAQALPVYQRELGLQKDYLMPIQQQMMGDYMGESFGRQATPFLKGANLAIPATGGSGVFQSVDPAAEALDIYYRTQSPQALMRAYQNLMPPQYASLFSPRVETKTETDSKSDASMSPFQLALSLGSIAAPFLCWVADEIYGHGSLEATYARLWISEGWKGWKGDLFRWVYRRIGPSLARLLHAHPEQKARVKPLFDYFAQRGWEYGVSRYVDFLR